MATEKESTTPIADVEGKPWVLLVEDEPSPDLPVLMFTADPAALAEARAGAKPRATRA